MPVDKKSPVKGDFLFCRNKPKRNRGRFSVLFLKGILEHFSAYLKRIKVKLKFQLNKKPDLVWIVMEFFQCDYILSLAFFFTITLIREYIIQHQDMKDSLL